MNRTELAARLQDVFQRCFFDDSIALSDALTAEDVDGWDSLSHVRLLLGIEDAFAIRLHSSEASALKNVGELLDLISTKVAP